MPSIIPEYEYDIFISYRQKDNRADKWVSNFVKALKDEIDATFKENISIYFDENPHDGLLETHQVEASLDSKIKSLIFIPVLSQTYCDPRSYAWNNEFLPFKEAAEKDDIGLNVKLPNRNVASRVLPVRIHELEQADVQLLQDEIGVPRAIDFIYKEPGVNRPLKPADSKKDNQVHLDYRNQVNKVANAVKQTIAGIQMSADVSEPRKAEVDSSGPSKQRVSQQTDFWEELNRRNVFRAGIAYVVVAWLLIQIAKIAEQHFSFPSWVMTGLLVVFIVGLPIALILAWYYERSPQGLVRTDSKNARKNPYSASQKKPLTNNLIIGGMFLIIVVMYFFPQSIKKQSITSEASTASNATDQAPKSIAILPFRNLSADPDQDYFSEGVAEMIRSNLSRVADLRVTSMRSVMQYTVSDKTISQIGSELNVAHVLEGSVFKDGDQVRVIVQLIDAPRDEHLWSATYDRELTDIFDIQTSIARNVVKELEAQLSPVEDQRVLETSEVNLDAYQFFLSATNNLQKYEQDWDSTYNERAINQLKQAIAIDPEYALARSWLSDAYLNRPLYGRGDNWIDSAFQNAQKAIDMDPEQSVAHFIIGQIHYSNKNNDAAINHLQRAIYLNPNYSEATRFLGETYINIQEYEKGLPLLVKSLQLNPVLQRDNNFFGILGEIHIHAGMNEKAEALFRKRMSLDPDPILYANVNFALWQQGKWEEARQNLSKISEEDYQNDFNATDIIAWQHWMVGNFQTAERLYTRQLKRLNNEFRESSMHHNFRHRLAYIWLQKGKDEEAEALLKENIKIMTSNLDSELTSEEGGDHYDLAASYLLLGNKEQAYYWLENRPHDPFINMLLKVDPIFDQIRKEKRFQKIMDGVFSEEKKIRDQINKLELDHDLNQMLKM